MNRYIAIGRMSRDPSISYTQGEKPECIARFGIAVPRPYAKEGQQQADFLNCVCFGKTAEVVEKWVRQGDRIGIEGRIQTGSYTDKEGRRVYTTDVMVERLELLAPKGASQPSSENAAASDSGNSTDGFMNIADNLEEDGLPFN